MKRIAVMAGANAENNREIILELIRFLKQNQVEVFCLKSVFDENSLDGVVLCESESELFREAELVISIGGDGTIIATVRAVAERGIPVCGLNMGRLGFLTELSPERWQESVREILKGNYWVEERLVLSGRLIRNDEVVENWIAVNDVVLSRIGYPQLLTVDVLLDGVPTISYPGDGVIVATPTGSTAYSLSAGGPIVSQDMEAIVVTPICAHDFYARSWVLSGETVVELRGDYRSADYGLTIDGKPLVSCEVGDRIRLQKAPWKMKFLRLDDAGHHQNLRTRFHRKDQL